jgi:hypothetical protein
VFEDDVQFIEEVKDGRAMADMDPEYELKNLKVRFDAWKKDFKQRLRDTKYLLKQIEKVRVRMHPFTRCLEQLKGLLTGALWVFHVCEQPRERKCELWAQ